MSEWQLVLPSFLPSVLLTHRQRDLDDAIEAARASERLVQQIESIRGREHHDPVVGSVDAVHRRQ